MCQRARRAQGLSVQHATAAQQQAPELPLDHNACIEVNLRYVHAQSGMAMPFDVAMKNNLVRRCMENVLHAMLKKGKR